MPEFFIESKKVSLLKGISWRIIGTMDTILLSWLFTGEISTALQIGSIEFFTKIILYYLHERVWTNLNIGRLKKINSGNAVYQDKHWKSFAKGISWRIVGTIDTITIAFFVTGNYSRAFEIGFTEVFTKMILFYLHERIWLRATGKKTILDTPGTAHN